MGSLKYLVLVFGVTVASPAHADAVNRWPAHADAVDRWRPYVAEASVRFGVPVAWIERVMRAESAGRAITGGRPTTSRAGAMGLMQLMPATWGEMRARLGLGADPHDPRDNILAGSFYLRLMYDRFGYPGLFAAYNAGPARYVEHLVGGRPMPGETRRYLAAVAPIAVPAEKRAGQPAVTLFFAITQTTRGPGDELQRAASAQLFFVREGSRAAE